ncbi:MAG: hypothetical protein RBG1_1C00001G0259 [candidate division Zixibacteria bacterium RBG-1]|nr:MAG: hypothetical protein RBG1_1C00001G0259 [candidate division Zixibacteria bacterium RBG-1]OGC85312.1 MAG: hypothetical protein A2V73_08445 [candidate division Zixibacteria bacterium RBG_19FT_COMBO_42_43]
MQEQELEILEEQGSQESKEKVREVKDKIERLFEEKFDNVSIKDIIMEFSKEPRPEVVNLPIKDSGSEIEIQLPSGVRKFPVHKEQRTGKKFICDYFPPELLSADTDVNPRKLVKDRLVKLVEAFMVGETRFQVTNGRLKMFPNNQVGLFIFDGSHGGAADLLAGNPQIFCKFYLPDSLSYLEALHWNNHAHRELRQQEFRGQVLLKKRNAALLERMRQLLDNKEFPKKTEEVFIKKFLNPLERKGMTEAIIDDVIKYILYAEPEVEPEGGNPVVRLCGLYEFVNLEEQSRRGGKKISYELLRSTIFSDFIGDELCDYDKKSIDDEDDPRTKEKQNLLRLCNLLVLHTLKDKWGATEDGTKKGHSTNEAIISERLWKKGAVRYWSPQLRETIGLIVGAAPSDVERIFQLNITKKSWILIEDAVKRLFSYGAWNDSSVADLLNTNKLETTIDALRGWATKYNQPLLDAYHLANREKPS